ncbi:dynein regulatory complex subunit 2-like isoform X3 [Harmonia axyridis]|uniref:dynein regulatory complex subunit 2-like isoform X3 n=1 Tax=Harmonia axyridis TaxID=115357 RepID=UPI001E2755C4|nr:dynein regulatory complex subunit 2-like isoform X3 [Harmonia axyridis]
MKKGKISKEEAKRLKQEQEAQVKRDYLSRERIYGQTSEPKYTKIWGKLLNEISSKHLKREVLAYANHFNKAIDYKDVEISLFLDWIEHENLRYWMCLTNHNHLMEYMIKFFYRGYKWIYNELGDQVNKLISLWVIDYDENKTRTTTNEEFLERMKYQMDLVKKGEEYETIAKNFSILNEKTSKYKFLLGDIGYTLTDKFEKMYWYMKEFTADYLASVRKKQKAGAESMERYDLLQKDIVANLKKRNKLEKLIQVLMRKYQLLSNTNERKLYELHQEHDFLHHCFLIFRENLFADKRNDTFKREILTVSFNDSYQELEKIAKKGSIMLKCLRACHKYETEEEKVLPFPEEIVVVEKHQDSKFKDWHKYLCLFWNRMASVNASRSIG